RRIALVIGTAPQQLLRRVVRKRSAEARPAARTAPTPAPPPPPDGDTPLTELEPDDGPRTIPINHHAYRATLDAAGHGLARPAAASEQERFAGHQLPPLSLLDDAAPIAFEAQDQHLRDRAALLEKTFTDFGLNVRVVGINAGPVITQFEVALQTGLRVNK